MAASQQDVHRFDDPFSLADWLRKTLGVNMGQRIRDCIDSFLDMSSKIENGMRSASGQVFFIVRYGQPLIFDIKTVHIFKV